MWFYILGGVAVLLLVALLLAKRRGQPSPKPTPVLHAAVELTFERPVRPAAEFGDESTASIDDFRHTAETPLDDFASLLKTLGPRLSVYALDDDKRVILVEADPMIHDSKAKEEPFLYQIQRKNATRAFAVPLHLFEKHLQSVISSSEEQKILSDVVFLHSTGRCGSTLLSRLFDTVGGVQSIAECDVYTVLAYYLTCRPGLYTDEEVKTALRCCSVHLAHSFRSLYPSQPKVTIKHRSIAVHIAEPLKAAVPEAKHTFLYRGPLPTVDSFCMAFFNNGLAHVARKLRVDSFFLYRVSSFPTFIPLLAPAINDPRFPKDDVYGLGIVGFTLMAWISVMRKALTLQQDKFFDACFRYEEMTSSPRDTLAHVLTRIGVHTEGLDTAKIEQVMKADAHGGKSRTSSYSGRVKAAGEYKFIRPADMEVVSRVLGLVHELRDHDFTLPDTFTAH